MNYETGFLSVIECYLLDESHDLQKTCEYMVPIFNVRMNGNTLVLLQSK